MFHKLLIVAFILLHNVNATFAENGYDLWLRYEKIENKNYQKKVSKYFKTIYSNSTHTLALNAVSELKKAASGMLSVMPKPSATASASLQLIKTTKNKNPLLNAEGYQILTLNNNIVIYAIDDAGLLYGSFHLIRLLQLHEDIHSLSILEHPKIKNRILNHWDNLDRTVERGYAGCSIFNWHELPEFIDQRYIDYARANASIGINGSVVTNVNANALVLTKDYIAKIKSLAEVFRAYGIKIYLTARFSAPIELGKLKTADPLDPQVQEWWKGKVKEIYEAIPDFGGFLVKANSEGQPGPQDYQRTHADGANMLADALAPYNGIVMWRAFVYSHEQPDDRAKQAFSEFLPLDGKFRSNVLLQVKNGPIDFQPREPFHPLFGAMKKTPLMMEFQITKEYLGQGTHLVGLATQFEEILTTDTYANGKGSTIDKVIDGSLYGHTLNAIAGVANIGNATNWTGHHFGQADWFAFGKLAWNPYSKAKDIHKQWAKLTFAQDEKVQEVVNDLLNSSYETCVNYMTPLGLHHIMAEGHHYGPGPWVDEAGRADWTSVYYHRADSTGIGFNRCKSGSNNISQYAQEIQDLYGEENKCPSKYLLWFHHVPWNKKLSTNKTLWEELVYTYNKGASDVSKMKISWQSLNEKIDRQRYHEVLMHLNIQEKEAWWWRDACLTYFQTFSKKAIPEGYIKPKENLNYYKSITHPFAPGIKPKW